MTEGGEQLLPNIGKGFDRSGLRSAASGLTKSKSLIVAVGCLLLALLVGLWTAAAPEPQPHISLASRLPQKIDGWVGQELPPGDLEVQKAANRLLNYDDYVYRVYRRASEEVFVYAMYWRQGSISVREIAGHTPDGCWVSNGARFAREPVPAQILAIGGKSTAPAEVRDFLFPNRQRVQVAWWHLWGGEIVGRDFDQKTLMPTLRELWVWLGRRAGRPREQWLVRIHTTGDLERALNSAPAVALVGCVPEVYAAKPL